ncbi:nucleolar protein 14 homolog isoform X2 [Prorops nasuta]|uniref:nucleolar protein 14 homolog isoform X2 n=1 Tax=Prorops nasuta TaxID=863751 RepID=UPI0034CFA7BD
MAKGKKNNVSESAQQKRHEQTKKKLNVFEIHINKNKFNVLGRKSNNDRGLPGISRAKAINKRKGTLLNEYKLKDKDNVFLDRRIGEKNYGMSQEEKVMARFTAERMKAAKKKNIYNLNDDEVLTHRGQTLEEIEKFDDPKSDDEFSDEENRGGRLEKSFVSEAHFGGGLLSKSDASMSRKDLIDQLIAESKKRKAEKQKIREQTIDLTEKLDNEWKDLLPIITASRKTEEPTDKPKVDDYDMAVRELKFEARGMPTDKLKSEEDIIKEEKEKLEALEADRLARMKGNIFESNNEIRHKSADDLDDDFAVETIEDDIIEERDKCEFSKEDSDTDEADSENDEKEEEDDEEEDGKEALVDEGEELYKDNSLKDKSESEEEVEDESDKDSLLDLKLSESSSEDEEEVKAPKVKASLNCQNSVEGREQIIESEETVNKVREENIRDDLLKRKEIMEQARKELPYTYNVPESYEDLQNLLEKHNSEYQSVIVQRIIKCNHWSLDQKNKEKLANLLVYLLQHINNSALVDNEEDVVKCFQIFDRLCPYLYDLVQGNPQNAKICIQEVLKEKHEEFEKNKKKYPNLDTLIFFKLVSLLFPTSDFRHPIVSPCLVFMSQILLRCRVRNRRDLSKGLYLCTIILEYTTLSKRFAPSVINFLRGILYTATPKHLLQAVKVIPPFKTLGDYSNLLILDDDRTNVEIELNAPHMRAYDLIEPDINDDFKIRAILTTVNLLNEFKTNLEELEAAYSIFEPIIKLLKLNKFDNYPKHMRRHIKKLYKALKSLKQKKLEYIVLEKKRPKPLKLYEPRIEKVYDGKRHKPMSKEKAEREKLLHKYKKEMKGAIREIRRDRSFLAKVQINQQIKQDEERKRKVKEIFGEAALQQSELKKMKRKK